MKKIKILFLGTQGFPFGMAEVEKQTLIARSLIEQGCSVTFVCNKSFNCKSNIPYRGTFKGVKYLYTSFTSKRLKNKYLNRIVWQLGDIFERLFLTFVPFDYAILNSRDYAEIKKYSILTRIIRRKKLFLMYTEDLRSMHPNADKRMLSRISDFENKTWSIIDGVFPISEELIRQVKEKNAHLPILKIPVLVDLADAENCIEPLDIPKEGYYLFCGSADYFETIEFIISGFEKANQDTYLFLVINGTPKSMQCVRDRMSVSTTINRIVIKSDLLKEELWGYYKFAKALLIPLNFDQRDKARFPHKIGEYCASGAAIVTSNWGEIQVYFKNEVDCVMLESNDPEEFAEKLNLLNMDFSLQTKLAQGSIKLAIEKFDYQLFGRKILDFLISN